MLKSVVVHASDILSLQSTDIHHPTTLVREQSCEHINMHKRILLGVANRGEVAVFIGTVVVTALAGCHGISIGVSTNLDRAIHGLR